MFTKKKFDEFLVRHQDLLAPVGDLAKSNTAHVMAAMAFDVCGTEKEAETAALRNVFLFAAEHRGSTLDATEATLADPMSRLRLWRIDSAEGQDRWMAALNLRQLKNWHAKGLRDFTAEIEEHREFVERSFSTDEIRELDLLQVEKGNPVFGQLARAAGVAAVAAVGVVIRGWWQ